MSKIYRMKLHEIKSIDLYHEVLRVPGGWIYTIHSSTEEKINTLNSVFVPFDNEFLESTTKDSGDSSEQHETNI